MIDLLKESPSHLVEISGATITLRPKGDSDIAVANFQPIANAALRLSGYTAIMHEVHQSIDMVILTPIK